MKHTFKRKAISTMLCAALAVSGSALFCLNAEREVSADTASKPLELVFSTDDVIKNVRAGLTADTPNDVVSTQLVDYSMRFGTVDAATDTVSLNAFDTNASGLLTDSAKHGVRVIKCYNGNVLQIENKGSYNDASIFYSFTFNAAVTVKITNAAGTVSAANSFQYAMYKKTGTAVDEVVAATTIGTTVAANSLHGTQDSYTFAEGDTMLYEIKNTAAWQRNMKKSFPTFIVYGADSFETYKTAATTELNGLKSGIDASKHSADDKTAMEGIIDTAVAAIAEVTSVDDVELVGSLKATAIKDFNDYLQGGEGTDTPLAKARAKAKASIQEIVDGLPTALYQTTTWQSILTAQTNFETAVDGLTRQSLINETERTCKETIDGINPDNLVADTTQALTNATTLDLFIRQYNVADGGEFTTDGVKGQLLYGTIESNQKFENIGTDGIYCNTEHSNKNSSNWGNYVWSATKPAAVRLTNKGYIQADTNAGLAFIIKLTATENVKISVTSNAWVRADAPDATAINAKAYVGCYDEETEKNYTYETWSKGSGSWPSEIAEGFWAHEAHVKAGESYYITVLGPSQGQLISCTPIITVDKAGFDESKWFDLADYIELQALLVSKPAELLAEMDTYASTDYTMEDYLDILALYDNASKDILECSTTTELTEYLNAFYAKINNICKTGEVEEVRASYLKKVTDKIATLKEADYKADVWLAIQKVKTDLEEALSEMTKKDEMNEATEAALTSINGYETGTATTSNGKKGGCGGCKSSMTLGGMAALLSLAGGVFLIRKRKDD